MNSSFSVHNVFGDHMVLQRSRPIRISGVAYPGVVVNGALANRHAVAVAEADGKWVLEFAPMEAGGPYELTLGTDHWSRTYRDIMIGDVWFCSGQSNMEFPDYPVTGVACTFDAGDAWDIHPPDKRTVALRLAHEAMRLAYGDASAAPGPRALSARRVDGGIDVGITDCGEGLVIDDGGPVGPRLFGLVGEDGKTAWTTASIIDGLAIRVDVPDGFGQVAEVLYCYSAFALGPYIRRKGDGLPLFPFRLRIG
ncbi:MAG: hypothetical protein IJT64_06205 [Kiritimatiellae bacterium]|nr:hypothetical protein [Kiritimatiellia bacterium]